MKFHEFGYSFHVPVFPLQVEKSRVQPPICQVTQVVLCFNISYTRGSNCYLHHQIFVLEKECAINQFLNLNMYKVLKKFLHIRWLTLRVLEKFPHLLWTNVDQLS